MAIESKYFVHDEDRAALEALQKIPGFAQLLKTFMKNWNEKTARLRNLSSYIRIDENQLPKYYNMLPPICEKLGIDVPELYLMMDVNPNAFTSGESNPYIVITSGLLDKLPDELIPTILAHECGHIACHHVLYRTMGGIILGGAAGAISKIPFANLITIPLQVAFFSWMRSSEYSADRAAILCDGTPKKMQEVCMHLAGFDKAIEGELNKEAFLKQAKEYQELTKDNSWNKTLEYYLLSNATHPFLAMRALECDEWFNSDQYKSIIDGTYEKYFNEHIVKKTVTPIEAPKNICPNCGKENELDAKFCTSCGTDLTKKCPDCGHELAGDEDFCPNCGKKLD